MAKLTIDGKELDFPDGTSLFDACREARGEALPHFCYHPDLSIAGVCRLCQVEVEGMPKLTIACNTSVRDGMVVHTRSERVEKAGRQILEMHLINHPVDCPICDQAGECGLQNQYMDFGLYDSRVDMADKGHKAKAEVIGPHVILDKERCVLCTRCVRFCREITGTGELGIFNRGDRAEIGTAPGIELDNAYSMNTIDICPVGALTSRDFRFQKRVWMLKMTDGVCAGCATGCNIRIDHEAGRIYRLKPRYNADVNGRWMCDRGRMTYKAVHDERRLTQPASKGGGQVSWADVKPDLTGQLANVGLILGSPHQTLEEMFLLKRLADTVGCATVYGGVAGADTGVGDELLRDADRTPNRHGLDLTGLNEIDAPGLVEAIRSTKGTILIHGGNPAVDTAVASALEDHGQVVYLGTVADETAAVAGILLPVAMWAEKAGIFANRKGRLQAFQQAIGRAGGIREDWRVLCELLAAGGADEVPDSLQAVRTGMQSALVAKLGADIELNRLPAKGFVPGGEN